MLAEVRSVFETSQARVLELCLPKFDLFSKIRKRACLKFVGRRPEAPSSFENSHARVLEICWSTLGHYQFSKTRTRACLHVAGRRSIGIRKPNSVGRSIGSRKRVHEIFPSKLDLLSKTRNRACSQFVGRSSIFFRNIRKKYAEYVLRMDQA